MVFEILGFKLKNENDKLAVGVCFLQKCNSVLNILVIMGILLYAKVSLLYNVLWECIVAVYT